MRPVSIKYYSECHTLREIYQLGLSKRKVITRNSLKPPFKKNLKKIGYI